MGKEDTREEPPMDELLRMRDHIKFNEWSEDERRKRDRWNRYGQARVEIPQGVKLGRRGSNGTDYEA
jgi:hypothetical protein